ncbi:hypothetical protein [Lysobacter sp. S4-A87]|nr:hypothetical protein [Lysobacter sp. S4-A87]
MSTSAHARPAFASFLSPIVSRLLHLLGLIRALATPSVRSFGAMG